MKYIILLMICAAGYSVVGQSRINYYPDSVRIELPEQKTVIVIEMREMKNSPTFIQDFPTFLKEITEYVRKSNPENFAETGPYHIEVRMVPAGEKEILSVGTSHTYKPVGEKMMITVNKIEQPKTKITVKEKEIIELLPPGWELTISAKEYKVGIYSDSFQSMASVGGLDFRELSDKIVTEADFKHLGKRSIRSRAIFKDNKLDQSSFAKKYPGDKVFLTLGAGIGLYNNMLYPQLSPSVGLIFNDRFTRPRIKISLMADYLFFAQKQTEGYQINVNRFLSTSVEFNFNPKGVSWTGLGVGFLDRNNGDIFQGNTMKFFISHQLEQKRFTIVPEFYLTDDFKKFTFGTSLRYTF
ncbi:MAG: hypothetical protein HOP08_05925 [Cyclobacteriaceae bacterium]|nr:hypothetical protein [Cyclobacteriaceae bacterium]